MTIFVYCLERNPGLGSENQFYSTAKCHYLSVLLFGSGGLLLRSEFFLYPFLLFCLLFISLAGFIEFPSDKI